jgi:hypothetical protein
MRRAATTLLAILLVMASLQVIPARAECPPDCAKEAPDVLNEERDNPDTRTMPTTPPEGAGTSSEDKTRETDDKTKDDEKDRAVSE